MSFIIGIKKIKKVVNFLHHFRRLSFLIFPPRMELSKTYFLLVTKSSFLQKADKEHECFGNTVTEKAHHSRCKTSVIEWTFITGAERDVIYLTIFSRDRLAVEDAFDDVKRTSDPSWFSILSEYENLNQWVLMNEVTDI